MFSALASGVWLWAYPYPTALVLGASALIPWIAFLLLWRYPGSFTVDGNSAGKAELWSAFIVSGVAVGVRAQLNGLEVSLTYPMQLLLPLAASVAIMMGCLWLLVPSIRNHHLDLTMFTVMMAIYAGALLVLANEAFDRAEPTSSRLTILHSSYTVGKGAAQYLTIAGLVPDRKSSTVKVSANLFGQSVPIGVVCVKRHPGFLNMNWFVLLPAFQC